MRFSVLSVADTGGEAYRGQRVERGWNRFHTLGLHVLIQLEGHAEISQAKASTDSQIVRGTVRSDIRLQ